MIRIGKLNLNKISLTSGITVVILFILCYLLFSMVPTFMYGVGMMMFHGIRMTNQFTPNFSGFLLGLIYSFIVGLVIGGIYVLVYNFLDKK